MTIKLKGGPELLRLLDELPKNLERNVIRGGLRAGAKVIQQQAKANVPVRTGKLKKAIGIGTRVEGSKLSSYVKLRGTGSYVGLFIEYGVAPHLISVSDADKPVRETRRGRRAVSIGTAKPIPTLPLPPPPVSICELMPITSPALSISGPPELPGLIAASVWITSLIAKPLRPSIERCFADTTPVVRLKA